MNSTTHKLQASTKASNRHDKGARSAPWLLAALASLPLLVMPPMVFGQDWTGGGTAVTPKSAMWSKVGSWSPNPPGTVAPGATTALVFASDGSMEYTATADAAVMGGSPFKLNSITFGPRPMNMGNKGFAIAGIQLLFAGANCAINQNFANDVHVKNNLNIDSGVTFTADSASVTTFSGVISDSGGPGTLTIAGTANNSGRLDLTGVNTYAGGTIVNAKGVLGVAAKALGSGPLTLNDKATIGIVATGASAHNVLGKPPKQRFMVKGAQVDAGVPVTINGGTTIYGLPPRYPAAPGVVAATLNFDQGVTLTAPATIIVPSGVPSAPQIDALVFDTRFNPPAPVIDPATGMQKTLGVLAGAGATSDNKLIIHNLKDAPGAPANGFDLTLSGYGILEFNAKNDSKGNVTINAGTLYVNDKGGNTGALTGTVTVMPGACLKGSGRTGKVTEVPVPVGAPKGTPPALVRPGDDPGFLVISNGLDLSGGELIVDLLGTNGAGNPNGYSQIQVTGGTTASNTILYVSLDYDPGSNDVFYLITSQDGLPLSGNFTNAYTTNGATYIDAVDNLSGRYYTFQISTTGDAANHNPFSSSGTDLVLFDAQPGNYAISLPPPDFAIDPQDDGTYLFAGFSLPAQTCILQATSSIDTPVAWTSMATNAADINGLSYFVDSDATNYPARYYRLLTTH